MKSIHIRDVEPATLDGLKLLARSHRRSLQGELHAILDQAVSLAPREQEDDTLHLVTVKTGGTSRWSRADIHAENADDFAPFAEVSTLSISDAFRAMTSAPTPE
jgi:plasmid stability protein